MEENSANEKKILLIAYCTVISVLLSKNLPLRCGIHSKMTTLSQSQVPTYLNNYYLKTCPQQQAMDFVKHLYTNDTNFD